MFANRRSTDDDGNILYQVVEEAIGNLLTQAGQMANVRIVFKSETGHQKGFGFHEFTDEGGEQNTSNSLCGTDFNGYSLRMDFVSRN
ncbi:hypothetical protein Q1695_006851 [Nippostrongylus brasiliensis]|nr:hypothetical protein Q1695_006851 [Nippostrongylus brasiliensis]